MDKIEVLAHIAAPSGFKDDRKFHAQAEAVANFEPCTRLQLYNSEEDGQELANDGISFSTEESTFHTSFSFSAWCQTDTVQETPAQKETRLLLDGASNGITMSSLRKGEKASQRAKDPVNPINWKATKQQAPTHNPPYSKPFLNRQPTASDICAARTPEVPRPKTAPAASVLPKSTALRQRALSDSSSFESPRSVVPDSQEKRRSATCNGSTYPVIETRGLNSYAPRSTSRRALPDQPPNESTRTAKRQRIDTGASIGRRSEAPNIAFLLGGTNPIPARPQRCRRISAVPIEKAITFPGSKSHWPPKPRTNIAYPAPPEQDYSPCLFNSLFHSIPAPTSLAETHDDWLFHSTSSTSSMNQSLEHDPSDQPFPSISSLPTSIHAPPPPAGHLLYTSHLTTSLRNLATHLPITTSFRPNFVQRDINVLERGHWHLQIPIISDSCLPPKDTTPPANEQNHNHSKETPQPQPWPETSFLTFFHALADHVRRGDSGWGVSIYREALTPASPRQPKTRNTGDRVAEIGLKVTCWGEVIPHIYLLMWVLSDKRTERLEMEWRDGKGDCVIRMQRSERAKGERALGLGRGGYGFEGGKGRDGRWGVIRKTG
jgi:hypothetical protein